MERIAKLTTFDTNNCSDRIKLLNLFGIHKPHAFSSKDK